MKLLPNEATTKSTGWNDGRISIFEQGLYKSQPQCLQKDLSFLDSLALIGIHLDRRADSVVFISSVLGPNYPQMDPIFSAGGDE
jgi:hypothetical protein